MMPFKVVQECEIPMPDPQTSQCNVPLATWTCGSEEVPIVIIAPYSYN
jgi:hypothetical protein